MSGVMIDSGRGKSSREVRVRISVRDRSDALEVMQLLSERFRILDVKHSKKTDHDLFYIRMAAGTDNTGSKTAS